MKKAWHGGTFLYSHHSGGRGRYVSMFKDSLVYILSFMSAKAT